MVPRYLAQFAFDLRMGVTRLLILRRLGFRRDPRVLHLVVVLGDNASNLADGIRQAFGPQRTAGTLAGLERVAITGAVAIAVPPASGLAVWAGHFAVLFVDDLQRESFRAERLPFRKRWRRHGHIQVQPFGIGQFTEHGTVVASPV